MRKCSVEIINGFLSSGKTTFLNGFLKKTVKREEVVVIQCEGGKEKIDLDIENKFNVNVKRFKSNEELTIERLIRIIKFYKPSRLVLESNGISDITKTLNLFNSIKLRAYFRVTGIVTVVNSGTLNSFLKNLPHLIIPAIEASDLIILNYCNTITGKSEEKYIKLLEGMNNHAHIVATREKRDLEEKIQKVRIIS
ncbi:GTP-binding protein [Clostridium sp.]|uniref:GTP-binding protein n=1 Tax=Clostridium sp. TaxID=1506 RepID=UPI0039960346